MKNPLQLRDYQKQMIGQLYGLVKARFRRILLIAIMGSGKTVVAAWIMRDAARKGKRTVFLVSLNVLLDQTATTLRELGVHCSVLQGDRDFDPSCMVVVASLQTIGARTRKGKTPIEILGNVDLIFTDESHITAFNSVYGLIEEFYPSAIKIGLSATPWRLSKKEWLGQRFDTKVEGPQPPEIVKMGGAVPCRAFTLGGALDLETLNIRNGDYIDSEIASQACRPKAVQHVIQEMMRLIPARSFLIICATVEQAWIYAEGCNKAGSRVAVIVGSTPLNERRAIFEQLRNGQLDGISSVGCLTAGFDMPCISAIIYVRATKSKALFHQSAGRGSRPHPGKTDYLLLDFGGNIKRLGDPMGWQVYDISQPQTEDGLMPTKTCPHCNAEINNFAKICPECGYEFNGEAVEAEEQDLILESLNEYADRFIREKIKSLRLWRKLAFQMDESPDVPIAKFVAEHGHIPPGEWMHGSVLTKRYSNKRKQAFIDYLQRHSKSNRWQQQWIDYHLMLEFDSTEFEERPDWTEILELPATADLQQVKVRYRELLQVNQYDHNFTTLLNHALNDAQIDFEINKVANL